MYTCAVVNTKKSGKSQTVLLEKYSLKKVKIKKIDQFYSANAVKNEIFLNIIDDTLVLYYKVSECG